MNMLDLDRSRDAVALHIKLPCTKGKPSESFVHSLRDMYRKSECTDVKLCCGDHTFLAHKVVLSAKSPVFKEGFSVPAGAVAPLGVDGRAEIRLVDVANPEAVKLMLDYIYEVDEDGGDEYNPRAHDVNKDVLILAQNFKLSGLTTRAMQWLTKDITTANAVEIVSTCETFRLDLLRERIIEQLTMNKKALAEVASSPQIMMHTKLMQALLQSVATVIPEPYVVPARKGGATAVSEAPTVPGAKRSAVALTGPPQPPLKKPRN